MTSREFCYWLQGHFEINGNVPNALRVDQVDMIKRHLALVFKHEIDPSYPNQQALNEIHGGPPSGVGYTGHMPHPEWPADARC